MTRSVADKARWLLTTAYGEDWWSADIETASDYAEPGYRKTSEDGVIVFGNWNDKSTYDRETQTRTVTSTVPSRLAEKLERVGADIEWSDEWLRCGDCYRAFRSQPDSYGWRMYGAYVEDAADYVCADCLREQFDLTDYVDNASNAITWASSSDMIEHGWEQWEPNDPQTYESGMHPGQNDDPKVILATIQESHPELSVVFLIDSTGQFDVRFSAWTKDTEEDS